MSKLNYFKKTVSHDRHSETTAQSSDWEEFYCGRWAHDKQVRSTHGVNCTGSCSWKIHVKRGVVTWETQAKDYPQNRPDMPDHEPRGCPRGASYSSYLYSPGRIKHPLVRGKLLSAWRGLREKYSPVEAWQALQNNTVAREMYQKIRGRSGFVRSTWDEVYEMIAAANIYTIKKYGPDRVAGFSPIPAMSMISYAAGTRYLSLLGGACLSFYDWYCDLPPSSPQTWGEQTDVAESADWYNSDFIILWGSNVPQTRTPDAHFLLEARYKGTKVVSVTPDYSEASRVSDIWLAPRQGTDSALGMAMGHVILKEFFIDKTVGYFDKYTRKYTDLPFLVKLEKQEGRMLPGRMLRASDIDGNLGESNNPEWKALAIDEKTGALVAPRGTIGFRWGEEGGWNLAGDSFTPKLSIADDYDKLENVSFIYYENVSKSNEVERKVPVKKVKLSNSEEVYVTTVFDLLCANYGVMRKEFKDENCAANYQSDTAYTPAWQEKVTGVPAGKVIAAAREFAATAAATSGRSMIIIGAGVNHWYHTDMTYRACINMLMLCGCVGQSGGGWAHYVGQEKLRPQSGWLTLAFALDWNRPPRHQNSTSFFYSHTDQWRYEKVKLDDIISPFADRTKWKGSLIDCNIRAERMGWLPSAPQLQTNPLELAKSGTDEQIINNVIKGLKSKQLRMSCEDPDNPANWPRNLFIWRSNLFGSSAKGHEYFLKHFLGASGSGLLGEDLGKAGASASTEVVWHEKAPEGKLDLVVTLDFRMSTTAMYSDVVLPSASWYEKNDLNTSDMHPFIHPFSKAVDPVFESRSDWDAFRGLAAKFSELAATALPPAKDIVFAPIVHDSPGELGQNEVKEWYKGECDLIPGKTMPQIVIVTRDYPNVYKQYTTLGPLASKNGGKGISWNSDSEVDLLKKMNGEKDGRACIETEIHACETILTLAPETNGHVAVKAWKALEKNTGLHLTHLAEGRQEEHIRFKNIQAQPKKIITSPIWSGIDSEEVNYSAGYTNVHENIPWRTLTGRQHFYQDHRWMLDFGEAFAVYKPPIDTKSVEKIAGKDKCLVLNFLTPHQKWGIHSTYSDNLIMQTLSRGGPVVWVSENDAASLEIQDNDWIEIFNTNGVVNARAIVSQRINDGVVVMYHAQEKLVNNPLSALTGERSGIHNSIAKITPKPTHMIGAYAQLAYGFNYYGTIGSNRDEYAVVRKLKDVRWED